MELFLQAAAIAVITVVLTSLLKKTNRELALLLTLAACILIGVFFMRLAEPIVDFLSKLRNLAGLDKTLMTPMLKTIGIGFLTQISEQGMAESYVSTLRALSSQGMLVVMIVAPVIAAFVGAWIANGMFHKHFKKAGMV